MIGEDLKAVVQKGLAGVVLPKCESADDVAKVDKMIEQLEKKRGLESNSVKIFPIIETAKGVVKCVIAICFGAVDFTRDMGTSLSKEGDEISVARSQISTAARAAGIQAIDTQWIDLQDKEGFIMGTKLSKQLGFKGKLLIHPEQIEPVNEIFSPSPDEIAYCKRVIETFKEAEANGLGAVSWEERMIDVAKTFYTMEIALVGQR